MFKKNNKIKLIDFGLSIYMTEASNKNNGGTPFF